MISQLIAKDSLLRVHPVNLHPRRRLILDGMRYSIEMAEFSFNRLSSTLLDISELATQELPDGTFAATLTDAWAVVDSMNRLRALTTLVPKRERASYITQFLDSTKPVHRLRNVVQHLHSRIDSLLKQRQPAWGTLSWVTTTDDPPTKARIHMLLPGSIQSGEHAFPNLSGEAFHARLDLITLNAHSISVSLSVLFREMCVFVGAFQKSLPTQVKDFPRAASELYTVAFIELGTVESGR